MQLLDEKILKADLTARQLEVFHAVNAANGDLAAAGRTLNPPVTRTTIQSAVKAMLVKAAKNGIAPGHWENGVAPGYRMGKVTVQRGAEGVVERVWERQLPDDIIRKQQIQAAIAAAVEELPPHPDIEQANADITLPSLVNLYTITDFHLGMAAWHREGGDDWDIEIAEKTLLAAFMHMLQNAPRAAKAIINIQGDFLHTDRREPVTPGHGHLLDAAGQYSQMVAAAVRVLRRVCDYALQTHDAIEVVFVEGNHDIVGSMWLRHMFAALYERNARLRVNDSELPYYAIQHGKTMLAFHHGHLAKNGSLPLLFAAQFPEMWGTTTKRYAHCGHRHHSETKEHSGMTVMQHQTLAARDAYAARGGWIADRAANCVTYHDVYGQVAHTYVTPDMFAADAAPVLRFRSQP